MCCFKTSVHARTIYSWTLTGQGIILYKSVDRQKLYLTLISVVFLSVLVCWRLAPFYLVKRAGFSEQSDVHRRCTTRYVLLIFLLMQVPTSWQRACKTHSQPARTAISREVVIYQYRSYRPVYWEFIAFFIYLMDLVVSASSRGAAERSHR